MLRRKVGHEDVLAHRRACARARYIRAAAAAVRDRGAIAREDGLTSEHVALLAAVRRVVIDGKRAHDGGGLLVAVAQVRLLAHEVLALHARRLHARLDHVVLGLELVAVGAVTLLEAPGRAVHPDSARGEAEGPARLPQRIP